MTSTLKVIITRDQHNQPLAIVHNLPGLDAEFSSKELIRLGHALSQAACDCERIGPGNKPRLREYNLTPDGPLVGTDTAKEDIPGMLPVVYICGAAGEGKTWIALGMKKQRESYGHTVVMVDTGNDITRDDILRAHASTPGNAAEIIVCWGASQAENFPFTPNRVIRIGRD